MSEQVTFESLVGEHELTGVDMSTESTKREWGDYYEDCEVLRFCLDGVVYVGVEDPDDGYRSSMRYFKRSDEPIKNSFAPVRVLARVRTKGEYGDDDDVLELLDIANGKVVLEVGTCSTNDYYPYWVGRWLPQNLSVNS